MPSPAATQLERACLAAILVFGAAIRLYGIAWGMDGPFVYPDSHLHFIRPAAGLAAEGDFTLSSSQFFHPPVLVYAIGAAYAAWSLVPGQALAEPGTAAFREQLPTLVLIGRIVCVAIAMASIFVVYKLARRLLGPRPALLGAAVFTLAPIHVLESHRIQPNGTVILLMLLASYAAVVALERASRGRLMLAFACAGLAGAAKYVGPFGGALPSWIALTWPAASGRERFGLLARGALVALAALLFGLSPAFFHVEPLRIPGIDFSYPVPAARMLLAIFFFAATGFVTGASGYGLTGASFVNHRFVYGLAVALPYDLGWPHYLAALAGLPVIWRRSRRAFGILAAFLLPFFLMQGGAALVVARYFEPMIPFLAISAGAALDALCALRRPLGAVLVAAMLSYTAVLSGSHVARLDHDPQRETLAFIEAEAERARAAGETLVVGYWDRLAYPYDLIRPRLQRMDVEVVHMHDLRRDAALEGLSSDEWLERNLRWLDEAGVDVLVLPSWVEHHFEREGPDDPSVRLLALLAGGEAGFRPARLHRSRFFTDDFYVWGDPMLETHWETGTAAYRLFVRADAGR